MEESGVLQPERPGGAGSNSTIVFNSKPVQIEPANVPTTNENTAAITLGNVWKFYGKLMFYL